MCCVADRAIEKALRLRYPVGTTFSGYKLLDSRGRSPFGYQYGPGENRARQQGSGFLFVPDSMVYDPDWPVGIHVWLDPPQGVTFPLLRVTCETRYMIVAGHHSGVPVGSEMFSETFSEEEAVFTRVHISWFAWASWVVRSAWWELRRELGV